MGEIPVELAGVAPALIIIIGGLRHADLLPDRFAPLFAISGGLGVGIGLAITAVLPWLPAVVGGVLAGGAAVGLHQVPKQLSDT